MGDLFSDAEFREAMREHERYVLGRRVGAGGVGVVYEAFDRRRKGEIAIKTLVRGALGGHAVPDVTRAGADELRRFKGEFRSLSDLVHPNLVALYELEVVGSHWFITMEKLRGEHFLDHVRRGGRLQEQLLRAALRQLITGVTALHSAGKLHRDIKSSNVMIVGGDRVILLDFGLVLEMDPATGTARDTDLRGTAAYIAPECLRKAPLTPAADLYSMGVLLYEALTGRPPFRGPTSEVLLSKLEREPPRPGQILGNLPPDLEELCHRLLRSHPAMRPSAEEIAKALGGAAPEIVPPRGRPVFVGRLREIEVLDAALDGARQGKLITVCVFGQSGIGKSALVRHVTERFERGGEALVFRGRCYERESMPYKALDAVIDSVGRHLSELPPAEMASLLPRDAWLLARAFPAMPNILANERASVEVLEPRELRRRTALALAALLGRMSERLSATRPSLVTAGTGPTRLPIVLAIDDVQWGDSDSAALFAELLRAVPELPLLVILCCRSVDTEASPFLRELLRPELAAGFGLDVRRIQLGPLPDDDSMRLVSSISGGIEAGSASAIAAHAVGNPFLVEELSRHFAQLPQAAGDDDPFEAVLDARMASLAPDSRRLLEVVVVAGRPLSEHTAAIAAGVDTATRRPLLSLRAERLILARAEPSGLVESYHDRIRETVLRRLTRETREQHHLSLAEVLEAAGDTDPEQLVEHYVGAGRPERAVPFARIAAERAATALAFGRAAALYELVLDHDLYTSRAETLTRLGEALSNGGRGGEAARRFEQATREIHRAEPGSRKGTDLLRRSAEQYLRSGFVDQGLRTMRDVLSSVGAKIPATAAEAVVGVLAHRAALRIRGFEPSRRAAATPAEQARLDAYWSAGLGLSMVDTIRSGLFQVRHQLLALKTGAPLHVARAFASQVAFVASEGGAANRARWRVLLPRAEALAESAGEPSLRALVELCGGVAAYFEHDFRRALSSCRKAERICREQCVGVAWEITNTQIYGLWALAQLGETDELALVVPRMCAEAEDRGDVFAATSLRLGLPNMIHLASDRPDVAEAEVDGAMQRWSATGFHSQHYFEILARVQIDLYRGDGATAHARLQRAWPLLKDAFLLRLQAIRVELRYLHARAALAAAIDAPEARKKALLAMAEKDARRITAEDFPSAGALGAAARAGIAIARGRSDDALAWLRDAAADLDERGMALFAAAARLAAGNIARDPPQIAAASAAMRAKGVVSPERMTRMLGAWQFR